MIQELNKFLSECRFATSQVAYRILNDQTFEYYIGRAIEALRAIQDHRGESTAVVANLKVAAKMCAFAYFRYLYGAVQATPNRKNRTGKEDS
jgi:hypothetical protein